MSNNQTPEVSPADEQAWAIYLLAQALSPLFYYRVNYSAFEQSLDNGEDLTETERNTILFGVKNIVPVFAWPVVAWTVLAFFVPSLWSSGMRFWGSLSLFGDQ